ncbi:hypothetical protein [Roseomonas sp. CECT 9278]|uniref:hypothetical protein n=1 Tax=Roseomonas sp. CECT 9278 TaxID=2845823 RepID=UPI001E3852D9|nr:hypothetical protein [Roseomonas sp. CECT 9278]CAH0273026.1 hypothetical protein ROS9278_03721 [Roseomonas sp. CECT 9278]
MTATPHGAPAAPDRSSWSPPAGHGGRWILACIGGGAVGLALAAVWNALVLPALAPGLGGMVAPLLQAGGGAVLGACLAAAQGAVMRQAYDDLPLGTWIGATAVAGYLTALVVGLVYGVLAQRAVGMPIEMFVLMGAALKGVVGGLLYGQAQGRVLDRVVAGRAGWTRVVMVGFMLGALLGSMRWLAGPASMGPASLVIGGLVGGALEGLALGLVTAGAFRFMPPRGGPPAPP